MIKNLLLILFLIIICNPVFTSAQKSKSKSQIASGDARVDPIFLQGMR